MLIKTKRLILREIKEEDAELIVHWRSLPEFYQYFFSPKPITIAEHRDWYFNYYVKDKNRIDFMALDKSRKKIGVFSIKRCKDDIQCSEIGYLLDKDAWGKGYAQEGVKGLMFFAKDTWKCRMALLSVHEDNLASQTLAYRLGYKKKVRNGKFFVYYTILDQYMDLGGG